MWLRGRNCSRCPPGITLSTPGPGADPPHPTCFLSVPGKGFLKTARPEASPHAGPADRINIDPHMGSGRGKRDKAMVPCCCGWCSGKQGHADVSSFLKQGLVPSYHLRARGQLAAAMALCLLALSQMGGAWTSAGLLVALDTHQPPVETERRTLWGSALPLPPAPPLSQTTFCSKLLQ